LSATRQAVAQLFDDRMGSPLCEPMSRERMSVVCGLF
jgi:hypothetical protein